MKAPPSDRFPTSELAILAGWTLTWLTVGIVVGFVLARELPWL